MKSEEDVAGTVRKAIAVQVLAGDRVVGVSFLDWGKQQRSTTTIVERAVSRLGRLELGPAAIFAIMEVPEQRRSP